MLHVFYGDVQVGTIGKRGGVPKDVDRWGCHCGFSPTGDRVPRLPTRFEPDEGKR